MYLHYTSFLLIKLFISQRSGTNDCNGQFHIWFRNHIFQCISKIFCVEFEREHKISYPHIERCGFYSQVNIQELLDLRAHNRFWNAPLDHRRQAVSSQCMYKEVHHRIIALWTRCTRNSVYISAWFALRVQCGYVYLLIEIIQNFHLPGILKYFTIACANFLGFVFWIVLNDSPSKLA